MGNLPVYEVFILMGLIIVLSFLSTSFFRWTRIPSSLLLIFVGVILHYSQKTFDIELLRKIAPFFGSFALLLILLEAGLEIDIRAFIKRIGPAILFAFLTYFISVICIICILRQFFDYNYSFGILLALVSVGGSPAILMTIVKDMGISKSDKVFIDLECTITEILGLILTLSAIPFLLSAPLININLHILKKFFIVEFDRLSLVFIQALLIPIIPGMIWSRILSKTGEKPLWPILTIGIALIVYGITELFHGKGALNVLLFALVIGNARVIHLFIFKIFKHWKWSGKTTKYILSFFVGNEFAKVKHISFELSFFVRTFFFVYLGTIVDFTSFDLKTFMIIIILTFCPMLIRSISAWCGNLILKNTFPNPALLTFLLPRGLANVLAAFAVLAHLNKTHLSAEMARSIDTLFVAPVFGVILLSNLILPIFLSFRHESELLTNEIKTLG